METEIEPVLKVKEVISQNYNISNQSHLFLDHQNKPSGVLGNQIFQEDYVERDSSKYFDSQHFREPEESENLNKFLFGETGLDPQRKEGKGPEFEGHETAIFDRPSSFKNHSAKHLSESNRGHQSRFFILYFFGRAILLLPY